MKISVVIPNYNGRRLLEKNLPAVIKACQNWRKDGWEIIVVDDASTDNSVDFLKKNYPQVKIVRHIKNQRFAAACNSGVKAAKGDIVVLLNSDVVPEVDFLKPLIKHFKDPQVFAVGCKEREIIEGRVIYSGRSEAKFERGFLIHWRAANQNKKNTFWATGGSMAIDRKKWLEIGGMDTIFRPAYWEDIDLSWRARKRGWKIIFEPKSIVNHHHESTNVSVFGRQQMKIFAYKNQFLFVWKNGDWKMLASHLVWLPYHLVKTLISKDWGFYKGFFSALKQLPEVIKLRK